MYWIYYIALPLFAAWKKRSENPAEQVYALYATMLSAFLAVWCEGLVRSSLTALIPGGNVLLPWLPMGVILLNWVIVQIIVLKIRENLLPEGLALFSFPEKVTKFLTPLVVFLHTGLICALIFTAAAASPAKKYVPFIFEDESLCSATRYRMLWNSFFVDRFSFQSATVTQRRRAFDRFVPEFPLGTDNNSSSSSSKRKD